MKWPTNSTQHGYMRLRKNQNLVKSSKSKAEKWMFEKLAVASETKWTRQAQWGYRLFDFWNHRLGIAVEVDGEEHDEVYDKKRDKENFKKSGIKVIRVRNFNEEDALIAIMRIGVSDSWNERRKSLGLKPIKNA